MIYFQSFLKLYHKMKVSRDLANWLRRLFDDLLPPFLHDLGIFMYPLIKMVFKNKAELFMTFKDRVWDLTEDEYIRLYRDIDRVIITRRTDLNKRCTKAILDSLRGELILEVGCGKAYLANKMSKKHQVTACDLVISQSLKRRYPKINFVTANIEKLPFKSGQFDTVVCTHTLEHVVNLHLAISELRRVTRKRLIIVVPKQRPFKFTFDLHLHFFPYKYNLLGVLGVKYKNVCLEFDGDWFYMEDK